MTLTFFPQVYFLHIPRVAPDVFYSFWVAHKRAWFMNYGSVKQVHFARVASSDEAVMSQPCLRKQGHGLD